MTETAKERADKSTTAARVQAMKDQLKLDYERKQAQIKAMAEKYKINRQYMTDRRNEQQAEADAEAKRVGQEGGGLILPVPMQDAKDAFSEGRTGMPAQIQDDLAQGQPSPGGGRLGADVRAAMASVPPELATRMSETTWAPMRFGTGTIPMPTQRKQVIRAPTGMTQAQAGQLAIEEFRAKRASQEAESRTRLAETLADVQLMERYGLTGLEAQEFRRNGAAGSSFEVQQKVSRQVIGVGQEAKRLRGLGRRRLAQAIEIERSDLEIRQQAQALAESRELSEARLRHLMGRNATRAQTLAEQAERTRAGQEQQRIDVAKGQLDVSREVAKTQARDIEYRREYQNKVVAVQEARQQADAEYQRGQISLGERNTAVAEADQKLRQLHDERWYMLGNRAQAVVEANQKMERDLADFRMGKEFDQRVRIENGYLNLQEAIATREDTRAAYLNELTQAQTKGTYQGIKLTKQQIINMRKELDFAEQAAERAEELFGVTIQNEKLRGELMASQAKLTDMQRELAPTQMAVQIAREARENATSNAERQLADRRLALAERELNGKLEAMQSESENRDRILELAIEDAKLRREEASNTTILRTLDAIGNIRRTNVILAEARRQGDPGPISNMTSGIWSGMSPFPLNSDEDVSRALVALNKGMDSFTVKTKLEEADRIDVDDRDAAEFLTKIVAPAGKTGQLVVYDEEKRGFWAGGTPTHIRFIPDNTGYAMYDAAMSPEPSQQRDMARAQLVQWKLASGWDANGRPEAMKKGLWRQNSEYFLRGAQNRAIELSKMQDIGVWGRAPTLEDQRLGQVSNALIMNLLSSMDGGP